MHLWFQIGRGSNNFMSVMRELYKLIRTIVWLIQYLCMYLWFRIGRCKNSDDTISEIAERVEHHHPIVQGYNYFNDKTENKRHACFGFGGNAPTTIKPKAFHDTEILPNEVPVVYPKTERELREFVLNNSKFRPIGSGHSFRGVVATDGILISLERMNRILSVDLGTKEATLQGGLKIRDALRILEEDYNLAVQNMGNYDRQSLGGAIVGGTHGTSGFGKKDTFTSSIVQMKMMNAKGETITLEPCDSVNFGIGGIIYEVTLRLVDFYYLEQKATSIDPQLINFESWWGSPAQFRMARWNFPGRPYEVCQLVEFSMASKQDYERDRKKAWLDRFLRVFLFRTSPFLPELLNRLTPVFFSDSAFVDKYYLQYVDDPAPHHTEWEYAVPYTADLSAIVRAIPEAVQDIKYTVEVHIRLSPQDLARGHLAHDNDVVWFDLNVVTPPGLSPSELDSVARKFENLMVSNGGVAHPHKLIVDIQGAGLNKDKIRYLRDFQSAHDPDCKLVNPALALMLGERK